MTPAPRYAVNCSLIFTELPLLQRPAAARDAGFGAVEFWWPWEAPDPAEAELQAFATAIEQAGVSLVALNLFAGDLLGADAGVASIPGRSEQFIASLAPALGLARRLGTRRFNAVFGNRVEGVDAAEQDELGVRSLIAAATAMAAVDGVVMVEPLSGPKPYPLRMAAEAMAIVQRVRREGGVDNVGLLADFFHLASNRDDVPALIDAYAADIAHVQIADAPGRHEPGTGELPLARWTEQLLAAGYDGHVALEYIPSGDSRDSFAWLSGRGGR